MQDSLRARSLRTLPFFWIHRALLTDKKPSWRAILAYNALAFSISGDGSTCRDVGIKQLAASVGVSEDTMKRGLDELGKCGAVLVKPRSRIKNGKRQALPNEYVLIDLATGNVPI